MIFGTYKLHKATSGAMPKLPYLSKCVTRYSGVMCINMSHAG